MPGLITGPGLPWRSGELGIPIRHVDRPNLQFGIDQDVAHNPYMGVSLSKNQMGKRRLSLGSAWFL